MVTYAFPCNGSNTRTAPLGGISVVPYRWSCFPTKPKHIINYSNPNNLLWTLYWVLGSRTISHIMVELWWGLTMYFQWLISITSSQPVHSNNVGLLLMDIYCVWLLPYVKNVQDNCTMLTMPGQCCRSIGAIPSMHNTVLNSIMAEYSDKSWLGNINLFLQNLLRNANFWGGLNHSNHSNITHQAMLNGPGIGDVLMLNSCSSSNVTAMTLPFAVPY